MQHFKLLPSTLSLMCFVILNFSQLRDWNLDIIKLIKSMKQWDIYDFRLLILIIVTILGWKMIYLWINTIGFFMPWNFINFDILLLMFPRDSQFQWKLLAKLHSELDSVGIIIMIGSSYSNYKRRNLAWVKVRRPFAFCYQNSDLGNKRAVTIKYVRPALV